MIEESTQPEVKDLIENIQRYCVANKKNVCFIASFIGFEPGKCCDCEEETDVISDEKSRMFIYGSKEDLRVMLNGLRDMIEDEADKDGFVSI